MTGPHPAPLLGRMTYLLGQLYRRALDIEADELAKVPVDVKQQAALTVLATEGPMTQKELGHRLSIDRSTIVTVVDDLEEGELLERRRNPADRRAYLLTLSAAGEAAQGRGQQHVEAAHRELLRALDEGERRQLVDLLARALAGAEG